MQYLERPICMRIGCNRMIGSLDYERLMNSRNPTHCKNRFCWKCRGNILTMIFRSPCSKCGNPFDVTRIDRAVCNDCRVDLHKEGALHRYRILHPEDVFRNPLRRNIYVCYSNGVKRPFQVSRILKIDQSLAYYHSKALLRDGFISKNDLGEYSVNNEFRAIKELLQDTPITK